MTRFVILSVPRAGSNLLCTLLNSHPEVLCHHEVFNPRGIFYALTHRDGSFSVGSVAERQRDPLGFLERLWDAHVDHGDDPDKAKNWLPTAKDEGFRLAPRFYGPYSSVIDGSYQMPRLIKAQDGTSGRAGVTKKDPIFPD